MELVLNPIKVVRVLAVLVIGLTLTSIAALLYQYATGDDSYFVNLFLVNKESNLPTFYSSLSLLFCSGLLATIAYSKRENGSFFLHWLVLSITFSLIALDEIIQFHERLTRPVRELLNLRGALSFAWVVPAMIFLLLFVLSYVVFLTRLPPRTRLLFVISGLLYVGGALGVEMIEAYYFSLYGRDIVFAVLQHGEEFFEMVGVLFFIYTLLSYLGSTCNVVQIRVQHPSISYTRYLGAVRPLAQQDHDPRLEQVRQE